MPDEQTFKDVQEAVAKGMEADRLVQDRIARLRRAGLLKEADDMERQRRANMDKLMKLRDAFR